MGNEFEDLTKLWEHYSKALQGKIEARIDRVLSIHNNLIKLREAIKEYSLSLEETCYKIATIAGVLKNFISCKQKNRESLLDYVGRFKVTQEVLTLCAGGLMCLLK